MVLPAGWTGPLGPPISILALTFALACGGPADRPAGARETPQPRVSATGREAVEQLSALGYVDWDEDADPELRGSIWHDPAATSPGYNLFSDLGDTVYLVDLEGEVVHRWTLPDTDRSQFAELVEGGRIVTTLGDEVLAMIGPDSEVLWRLRIAAHHDAAMAPDGSLFVLTNRWIVFEGRQVLFDGIAHVSAEGELLDQWWTFDWLAELQPHHRRRVIDSPPAAGERAGAKQRKRGRTPAGGLPPATTIELRDYYHANSIELLPDTPLGRRDDRFRAGNLMICLHQVDLVMILDQEDYSVTWSWGAGELDWPHMPTMLENGNILVFDNGSHRDFSRVLEIEPPSGRIVWSYEADPPQAFYTKFRGCNQRLPNGNTVICESERGRVFEVTREGRIVWEYWNPIVEEGRRRRISRFTRYPAEFVAPLLEASAAGG